MLMVTGVTKSFGSKEMLRDVSMSVPRGSVSFLMGPNGAGKTTLIKCILRLHSFEGSITFDGVPLDPSARLVAPVFDEPPLHPRLTGTQNISVLCPESLGGPISYLSQDVLSARVKGYSHGQRMRLALMMAINSGAPLIILDEPTNGLDRETMAQLKADIGAMRGDTTFLVTGHHLEFYDDLVDHLFVLEQHRVSADRMTLEDGRRTTLAHVYDEHYASGPQ